MASVFLFSLTPTNKKMSLYATTAAKASIESQRLSMHSKLPLQSLSFLHFDPLRPFRISSEKEEGQLLLRSMQSP